MGLRPLPAGLLQPLPHYSARWVGPLWGIAVLGHRWCSQDQPLGLGHPPRWLLPSSAHTPFSQSAASSANLGSAAQASAMAIPELRVQRGLLQQPLPLPHHQM